MYHFIIIVIISHISLYINKYDTTGQLDSTDEQSLKHLLCQLSLIIVPLFCLIYYLLQSDNGNISSDKYGHWDKQNNEEQLFAVVD